MSSASHSSLDLDELFRRESARVEWKDQVADTDDVVATLSAFANDLASLGGGWVVCGAAEEKDEHGFARMRRRGLDAARCKEVCRQVIDRCAKTVTPPITPRVEELSAEDPSARVVVFEVAATAFVHSFRPKGKDERTFVRLDGSTQEARNGRRLELALRKGAIPPWSEQLHGSAVLRTSMPSCCATTSRRRVIPSPIMPWLVGWSRGSTSRR